DENSIEDVAVRPEPSARAVGEERVTDEVVGRVRPKHRPRPARALAGGVRPLDRADIARTCSIARARSIAGSRPRGRDAPMMALRMAKAAEQSGECAEHRARTKPRPRACGVGNCE